MEVKRRTAQALISKLSSVSDPTKAAALCELRHLSNTDPNIRPIIAEEGAIPILSKILLLSTSPLVQENAAVTLLNVSISCPEAVISDLDLLKAISNTLSNHSHYPRASVQAVAATVYSLSIDERFSLVIGSKWGIISALIDIVRSTDSPAESMKDALKALYGIALCGLNRATMLELEAAKVLFGVVKGDKRVCLVEDSTAVIEQIAGCEESVDVFRRVSGISTLVDMIDPGTGWSAIVRENAVSGLLKLVKFGGWVVVEEIRDFGQKFVLHGLGKVAQNGSARVRQKAEALIDILGGVSPEGLELSPRDESDMGSDSNSCSFLDS